MKKVPRARFFDGTISLFLDGYEFIGKRCDRLKTDIFETRLMLQKTICLRGEEAAVVFYDADKFERKGAFPKRGLKTLLGVGGVQTLDGERHRHRKQMFMSLMTAENVENLADLTRLYFQIYSFRWEQADEIVLFDETQEILCRAVCEWAGVPLSKNEFRRRTGDFEAIIESGARIGWRHWRGRFARRRAEDWIGKIIEEIRRGNSNIPADSAAALIANFREMDGSLLDTKTASVELLNILRPTVAAARYIVFAAHALHENPGLKTKLAGADDEFFNRFLEEVRRFYPFFPFVAAVVKKEFVWNGYHFPKGRRVILDLYATSHDSKIWKDPHEFRPERFAEKKINDFNLIPQGGNGHHANHRCPGERITLALMKTAVEFLTASIAYEVPPQNLRINLRNIPSLPESRFIICNVRSA